VPCARSAVPAGFEAGGAFIVETHAIEPDRLEAEGFGESKPVDTNENPEGRQSNRRVELVKLSRHAAHGP
jgi:flagellar motor protein MotB